MSGTFGGTLNFRAVIPSNKCHTYLSIRRIGDQHNCGDAEFAPMRARMRRSLIPARGTFYCGCLPPRFRAIHWRRGIRKLQGGRASARAPLVKMKYRYCYLSCYILRDPPNDDRRVGALGDIDDPAL